MPNVHASQKTATSAKIIHCISVLTVRRFPQCLGHNCFFTLHDMHCNGTVLYIWNRRMGRQCQIHCRACTRRLFYNTNAVFVKIHFNHISTEYIHNAQKCTIGSKASSAHLNNRLLITDNSKQNIVQIRKLSAWSTHTMNIIIDVHSHNKKIGHLKCSKNNHRKF